jgi:hypothetical protein
MDQPSDIVTTDSHSYIIESVGINPDPVLSDLEQACS